MSLKAIFFGEQKHFTKTDKKVTILLLMAALVPTLHQYLGTASFYYNLTSSEVSSAAEFWVVGYFFLSTFALMGLIPFLIVKFIFKEKVSDFGFQIGDWKNGLSAVAILFPIIAIAFLLPAAYQEELKNFYPLYKDAENSVFSFLGFEFSRGVFYYSAWEFFFRGFLLFGMRKYVGDWAAILIQTIPSCLWHIGYPTGEILMSIPAGIMFGIIALRSNSIVWVWLLHWLIGAVLDGLIILTK